MQVYVLTVFLCYQGALIVIILHIVLSVLKDFMKHQMVHVIIVPILYRDAFHVQILPLAFNVKEDIIYHLLSCVWHVL